MLDARPKKKKKQEKRNTQTLPIIVFHCYK